MKYPIGFYNLLFCEKMEKSFFSANIWCNIILLYSKGKRKTYTVIDQFHIFSANRVTQGHYHHYNSQTGC